MSVGATAGVKKSNGKYLWWCLLSQGFEPEQAAAHLRRTNVKHIQLGIDMFDKPNKDAFYIVSQFLLEKLNPTRFHDSYRHCWPVLDHKADAEFRKMTCAWLREIMDENGSGGPKVVASLFLSPGGPKFVNLMLHLANHVMLQEMKTFTRDASWVPETAALPASSLDMAGKRFKLTRARFLKHSVEQDQLLHEYQRRAQSVVKSNRDNRAESAKYDKLLKHHNFDAAQDGMSLEQKTQKVRALWLAFDGLLSAIKEEWRVTDCVTRGDVDQYSLDGRDVTLKLPRVLLDRIEQLPQHLSTGNVYEGGQLNLLCVLELMNHALQLLKEEWSRSGGSLPQINLQHLEEKRLQIASALDSLLLMRDKITKEEVPEIRNAIKKLELEWDRKWTGTQKDNPLASFLNDDPALAFLSPMAPLSFDVENDGSFRANIFSQYPAKLLEFTDAETKSQRSTTMDSDLESIRSPPVEMAETPVATSVALPGNTSLCDFLETSPFLPVKTTSLPQHEKVSMRKTALPRPRLSVMEKKVHILDRECDNLADQFADAVTTSHTEGRNKGLDLEDLLITMGGDPFSTRKQLPRTPESLISDVKSSWRKAIQSQESDDNSLRACFSPLAEADEVLGTPEAPSQSLSCDPASATTSHSSPPEWEQGVSHTFTPSGESPNMDALCNPVGVEALDFSLQHETLPDEMDNSVGTSVEALDFSLHHETLPDAMDGDSMLSLGDEPALTASGDTEEDELLLPDIPSLKMDARRTPLAARQRIDWIQQTSSDSSFMDNRKQTPDFLLSHHSPHLSHIMESPTTTGQVFSLDLDALESHSPPSKQEYSLPNLVTFSPIESGSPSSKQEYSLPKLVTFSPLDDI